MEMAAWNCRTLWVLDEKMVHPQVKTTFYLKYWHLGIFPHSSNEDGSLSLSNMKMMNSCWTHNKVWCILILRQQYILAEENMYLRNYLAGICRYPNGTAHVRKVCFLIKIFMNHLSSPSHSIQLQWLKCKLRLVEITDIGTQHPAIE